MASLASKYELARRRRRREAGLCERAGCNERRTDTRFCDPCRQRFNAAQRAYYQRRKASGKCRRCEQPPRTGSQHCPEHHAQVSAYKRAWDTRRKGVAA